MTQKNAEQALVTLSGISKAFDGKSVIEDFSLTINHGEFLTLLGPSGCGKTTVLRLLAGLETCDSGKIWLEADEITELAPEKRHINTVFQSYALFPHMSVFENVAFGLRMQKLPKAEIQQRVNDALAMVQLADFAKRKPAQLSGGQQQRVAIARAVVNRPKILLLDESLSALDYKLRKQMQNELKALQRKLGITFVFVTHDQEEALSMSDRIVVMRDGRIEQDGTPRIIYEEPSNLFVARFIGEINQFDAQVLSVSNENEMRVNVYGQTLTLKAPFPVQVGDTVHILLRPEDLRIQEVSESVAAHGLSGTILERNYKGSTLESVVALPNGQHLLVTEFFNEDDPDFDHSLNQPVQVTWVKDWEVVLPYEKNA